MTFRQFMRWAMIPVGTVGGWMYYHFIGCPDGTCAIASNQLYMVLYGTFIGYFLGALFVPVKKETTA
jgi:hypothetical protein